MTPRRAPMGARVFLASMAGIFCLASVLSASLSLGAGNDSPPPDLSREETVRLGDRIYRDGILPSGEPFSALVQGDIPVEGTMFSCERCHLRSGLGSFEGGVLTPPTNGNVLYSPWNSVEEVGKLRQGNTEGMGRLRKRSQYLLAMYGEFPSRSAYTDKTLAIAIRDGGDPESREFIGVMPRYTIGDRDMAVLVAYLKLLSKDPSPGVTETTIRFATVITDDVGRKERDAMLGSLDRYLRIYNSRRVSSLALHKSGRGKRGASQASLDPESRQMSLSRWELKGSPETWRDQLEEYYRKEPVFALLGGITTREWRPVHEFSEAHGIPCLFPITDLPVVSSKNWYTLYFSKGFYQEGEMAARHLARSEARDPGRAVVQVYPDTPEGKAFAAGFREAWNESGRRPVADRALPAGTPSTREILERAIGNDRQAVLVLWAGAEAFPALDAVAGGEGGVSTIYMSASLLKDRLLAVPETLRGKTYITYPYGLPGPGMMPSPAGGQPPSLEITDRKIAGKMDALSSVLTEFFIMWQGNFYRDYMLDVIDGSMLMVSSPYERVSFGPGQRYASKGCYIVQLSKGDRPEFVRKSDWVIH
jgi:hypothetical protein